MSITSKESRETMYWLKLLQESDLTHHNCTNYLVDVEEIIKIITAITKTAQANI
jgi:four helix bundle protein